MTLEKRLAQHPFLRSVSGDNVRLLAGDAVSLAFKPGERLFRRGQTAKYLFLIEKGRVQVGLRSKKSFIPIASLGAGDNLGWSWVFAPFKWKFEAVAQTSVEALALEGKPVVAQMGHYPLLGYELMKQLALSLSRGLEATRRQLARHLSRARKN
jgi:CRP-like cAMP-binding protein